jgi:methylase of polypeptide subunit release factors
LTTVREPAADPELLAALVADLTAAGYTVEHLDQLIGPIASAALGREQPVPALRATDADPSPAATLTRLWVLGRPVAADRVEAALPRTGVAGAARLGLLSPGPTVTPTVDLRPYAADDALWWLASDLTELATGTALPTDYVLGVGGASATLARWSPRRPVARALDVGTGCGVQAFHLATHADSVTATDLSDRALRYAAFNAGLNAAADGPFAGRRLDLRRGDMFAPVTGERFGLVVSNPPFVITPRRPDVPQYAYRDGLLAGDEVVARFVRGVGAVLAPGGCAQLLGNWEHHRGESWQQRLERWLADSGLDGWVIQREVQDPAEYAETWIRDGGCRPGEHRAATSERSAVSQYDAMYAAWLDDFAARGVEAVGFGVITLRRPEAGRPVRLRRCEEIRTPIEGGVGETVAASLAAESWLADRSDAQLAKERLSVADDVTEERFGLPGAEDPAVIRLRQGGGLGRVVTADTALAGFVGACDGELSVAQILAALATLLEAPVTELAGQLLPATRELVRDGLLIPADSVRRA